MTLKVYIKRLLLFIAFVGFITSLWAGDKKNKERLTLYELRQHFTKSFQPTDIYTISQSNGEGDINGVPITFSGSFRFFGMYRVLYDPYPNEAGVNPINLNMSGFGDGSIPTGGSPLLTIMSKITPAEGVDIGVGIGLNHIFSGSSYVDSTRNVQPFGQTFGAYVNFKTSLGNVKVGGGNLFTGMSELFSGWSTIRWNPFYRLPWESNTQWGGSWESYNKTYENGSVTNFDPAYATGGRTEGVILQLSELPGDFGINLSYGVTGQTGLYQSDNPLDLINITKKTFGGRVYKKVNAHEFGITGIVNNGYVGNISNYRETQYMYSTDNHLKFNKISFSSEIGVTAFTNPFGAYEGDSSFYALDTVQFSSGNDFLLQAQIDLDKSVLGLPLKAKFYHLGPYYINVNGGAFNTSTYNNTASYIQVNDDWDVAMRRGFIADINQTANNRRALELSTEVEKGRFIMSFATQVGSEIQKAQRPNENQIMFYHHLNSWSRAGFNYWTPQGGPYQKLLGNFIQLLESVPITDSVIDYKKTFNVFSIETRYKTALWGRPLILVNYTNYQSASDKFSPLPYFTDNAFVRVLYNELTAYFQLYEKTVLVGHVAYNQAKGNDRTDLSPENGKPIDQQTWGAGVGLDWNFATNMGLYFREFWMTHSDKNFSLDHFEGFETSVELKVMF